MKRFLNKSSWVFLGALSLSVSACGQNANITKPAPQSVSGQDQKLPAGPGTTQPGTQSGTTQKDQGPAGPAGPQGLAGAQGPAGVAGVAGAQGPAGPAGRDGCGVRTYTYEFEARPLNDVEKIAFPADALPYLSNKKHKMSVLQLGEMTGLASGNYPYVFHSQVMMAIDVSLPPKQAILKIKQLSLKIRASKISSETSFRDEMLCFLDEKICSGETIPYASYKNNINSKFFDGSGPVNAYFSSQYLDHEVGTVPVYRSTRVSSAPEVTTTVDRTNVTSGSAGVGIGLFTGIQAGESGTQVSNERISRTEKPGQSTVERKLIGYRKIYEEAMTLPISDLIKGSGLEELGWIYGNQDPSMDLERTVHIAVAADTYIDSDAKLVMTIQADSCKMNE